MRHIMAGEQEHIIHENLDAEQGLLGYLLGNSSELVHLEGLENKHFASDMHRRIFDEITTAFENSKALDIITIKRKADGWMDDGGKYVVGCVGGAIHVTNPKDYADEIIKTYERRELDRAMREALNLLSDYEREPSEAAEYLTAALDTSAPRAGFVTEQQLWTRLYENIGKEFKIYPTGLSRLDTAMDGGIHEGMMYGLVGRKKAGKTMLACTISEGLLDSGVKHLFLALEMGSERIHRRAAARRLGVNEAAFKRDYGKSDKCLKAVAQQATKINETRLWSDAPRTTIDNLRREVVTAKRVHGITGFIVDGWQLVTGKDPKQTNASHLDHVSQVLAELCMKYKLWCVVTAQANQDGNTRDGEGLRMACDQVYQIMKPDDDTSLRWIEMMDSRYTEYMDIGSENSPALMIVNGTHVEEI